MMNIFEIGIFGLSQKNIKTRRARQLAGNKTDHPAKDGAAFKVTEKLRDTPVRPEGVYGAATPPERIPPLKKSDSYLA